jgi:catechol 2,3-dioxygenase-like lactoylglutathione lyase family enzyme
VADLPGGRLNHVNPILNVSNLTASIAFYTEVLRFELLHTFGDPADFAIVGRDGNQIYLCEHGQGHAGTWLALFVADPAAMYEHLTAENVEMLLPYEGSGGEFRVVDPDSHVLRFFG